MLHTTRLKNKDRPCYFYDKPNCTLSQCPKKEGMPRDKWFDKTGKVLHQRVDGGATVEEMGFSGLQVLDEVMEDVTLDSGSTISLLKNE